MERRDANKPDLIEAADSDAYARRVPAVCDFCDDDSDFVFEVRVRVYALDGSSMLGKRICDLCITEQGFTGWSYSAGRWPVRDPLGRAHPFEADIEPPLNWREIGAALEGRSPDAPLAEASRRAESLSR